jgi:glycosidase
MIRPVPGIRWLTLGAASFAFSCVNPPVRTAGLANDQQPWWKDGVCYEIFVRSFADSDGDGIGDLRGLTARLDYVSDGNPNSTADLGASCIWLMPISRSMSYHGYDVVDYYHVNPQYGTDEDFRTLAREAHRRGIRVIVDFVPNHSASENPYFRSALQGPSSPHRDWYRWSATKPAEPGPWGQQAWHKSPVRDEYYYGVFWHEMPDLNYQTPAVLNEMKNVTRHWLTDMGADGFRFDAIPYLVEEGSQLKHTRGTHDVLRQLGAAIRSIAPSSFTIGEMADGSAQILASYYPDQLDAYFAFDVAAGTLQAARTGEAAPFLKAVREADSLFPPGRWSPFLTNHDQPRVMTVLGGDRSRARVAASAMLMLPGLPFVYYGEEIGMSGTKPDEQIRTPMQWSSEPGGGFTAGRPWESPQPDWAVTNVRAQEPDPGSLLNHYRQLIHLRNSHPALSRGSLTLLETSDTTGTVAAWLRSWRDDAFLIVVNFGQRHGDLLMERLPRLLPGAWNYRLQSVYADPDNACVGYFFGFSQPNGAAAIQIKSLGPHGFCALRILRR